MYVTTEESRESIIRQAAQFNMDFQRAIDEGRLMVVDVGYGRARVTITAFLLSG